MRGHKISVLSVASSLDSRYLASGGSDKMAKLWSIESQTTSITYHGNII
jgi:WD40 repeat protein